MSMLQVKVRFFTDGVSEGFDAQTIGCVYIPKTGNEDFDITHTKEMMSLKENGFRNLDEIPEAIANIVEMAGLKLEY